MLLDSKARIHALRHLQCLSAFIEARLLSMSSRDIELPDSVTVFHFFHVPEPGTTTL